jgi:hypothetical protein
LTLVSYLYTHSWVLLSQRAPVRSCLWTLLLLFLVRLLFLILVCTHLGLLIRGSLDCYSGPFLHEYPIIPSKHAYNPQSDTPMALTIKIIPHFRVAHRRQGSLIVGAPVFFSLFNGLLVGFLFIVGAPMFVLLGSQCRGLSLCAYSCCFL